MKRVGTYLFVGLFLLIGLRSCMITLISIDDYMLLERKNESGQQDLVILTPNYEMIHTKKYQDINEIGIYNIKGHEATHYLFGLYCIGSFPFGLRYYSNAEKVFETELVLVKKIGNSFPEIGKTISSKIVIFEDKAIIDKITFDRVHLTESEREDIDYYTKQLKSSIE
jgi:hypothetical protein